MSRHLYSLLLYLLVPVLLARAAWRGRVAGSGERLAERLGFVPASDRRPVLVHCVSVGETVAAQPLVSALLARGETLWLTSTTLTGAERVRALFGDRVLHSFLPLDTPIGVALFLDRVRPRALLVMETEVWPNLLAACRAREIPTVLVNARLSERSARGYARIGSLVRDAFGSFSAITAQSAADAQRLTALGAPTVSVTGNLKFDLAPAEGAAARAAQLRATWGSRPVWIAASTHADDDAAVLAAHRLLCDRIPGLVLVLVPRHPQRFDDCAAAIARAGFSCARRSRQETVTPDTVVYLADTMGELGVLYAAADIAFVGGSFSGTGGHNYLEPAALGLPVVSGPSVFNFQSIADELGAVGALRCVNDVPELAAVIGDWLADAGARAAAGEAGRAFVVANRGALERTLAVIDGVLTR